VLISLNTQTGGGAMLVKDLKSAKNLVDELFEKWTERKILSNPEIFLKKKGFLVDELKKFDKKTFCCPSGRVDAEWAEKERTKEVWSMVLNLYC
jgi:hypothetical protein